jgi:DNA-binding NtrC family response regulator
MKSVLYLGCPMAERADAERQLSIANVSVVWADNVSYALSELERRDMPVLLDLSRGAAALQSAREIRTQRASTLMFAVVDARRPDLTTEAVLVGMADVFARPLGARRVAKAIVRELHHESRQNGDAATTDDLYGHSPAMRDVLALIARAATMRAGVLIRGEEGTGRQVVARAIHALHNDNPAALIVVDCAAYDGDQLEVALFGAAARGAAADQTRVLERVSRSGLLHDARGGTLYLQNVVEAPARAQMRLSRLLRDREAVLADSNEPVDFDVRPIAGVGPTFDTAVHEGRVREDLVRRLSVLRIEMPPLRHRREDIAALANYFLREICASRPVPPKTFSRSALSLLAALPWRGNAAELQSVLTAVVAGVHDTRSITLDDVLAQVRLDGAGASYRNGGTLRQARARFERDYIASVLEQHRGRISEAAKALGIQRTNLYRKMRALRVHRDRRS